MNTTGDPGWKYHVTTTKIWSMITAYLSESPVMLIKAAAYAVAMQKYVGRIQEFLPNSVCFDFEPFKNAITEIHNASIT